MMKMEKIEIKLEKENNDFFQGMDYKRMGAS